MFEYFKIRKKARKARKEYNTLIAENPSLWTVPSIELTDKEKSWLRNIHALYYGRDWYVVDALGAGQVFYIMYKNITGKIMYMIFMSVLMLSALLYLILR